MWMCIQKGVQPYHCDIPVANVSSRTTDNDLPSNPFWLSYAGTGRHWQDKHDEVCFRQHVDKMSCTSRSLPSMVPLLNLKTELG